MADLTPNGLIFELFESPLNPGDKLEAGARSWKLFAISASTSATAASAQHRVRQLANRTQRMILRNPLLQ
jgi:hypothetical protein